MGPNGPRPGGRLSGSLVGRLCRAVLPRQPFPSRAGGGGNGNGARWQRVVVAGSGLGLAAVSMKAGRRSSHVGRARSSSGTSSITTFGNDQRRVTDSLIVMNVLMFGLQAVSGQQLLLMGAKINSAIHQGEWWRLMTAAFLHADILHLGFNCNALHQIGPMVEVWSGSVRFGVIYLGSAIAGNLASMMFSPHMSVGASGAIFGVAASLAVFAYRHRALMGKRADYLLKRLSDTAAINFMYGLIIRRIDNWGHLGGLLGGAALTYLLGPRLVAVQARGSKGIQLVDRPPLPILADRRSERK